jgi:hypothetical protein
VAPWPKFSATALSGIFLARVRKALGILWFSGVASFWALAIAVQAIYGAALDAIEDR